MCYIYAYVCLCIDSSIELLETLCNRVYMHECECKTCERWETQHDQSIFEIIHKYTEFFLCSLTRWYLKWNIRCISLNCYLIH